MNMAGEASAVSTSMVARRSGSLIGGRSSSASIEPEPRAAATTDHSLGRLSSAVGCGDHWPSTRRRYSRPTSTALSLWSKVGVEIEAHAGNGGGVNGGLGAS